MYRQTTQCDRSVEMKRNAKVSLCQVLVFLSCARLSFSLRFYGQLSVQLCCWLSCCPALLSDLLVYLSMLFLLLSSLPELAGPGIVMTPFPSVLCRRFQFIVAELGVSFCHDPVKHLDPWLHSCSFSFHLPFESCSQ